ncbi:hypothetical protein HF325_004971 [Metschnikowia pulcherrima]|uniref:Uncharacterized protein n=1 Tax=Metschnikowia pulcherrima TaxID=27326 RepID=A0A8H7LDL7_9ASCO|nr:hypothetical protein HF325_004971 [Metschnikowia pulcherrima]
MADLSKKTDKHGLGFVNGRGPEIAWGLKVTGPGRDKLFSRAPSYSTAPLASHCLLKNIFHVPRVLWPPGLDGWFNYRELTELIIRSKEMR